MSKLDKVSFQEYREIVQKMEPKIGPCGGRHFTYDKKTYSMNQLTKRFCDEVANKDSGWLAKASNEWSDVAATLLNKDQEATEMLKKASCTQKLMTKMRQKCGNGCFKDFYGVNKTAVLKTFAAEKALPDAVKDLRKVDSSKIVTKEEVSSAPSVIFSYSKDILPESFMKHLIKNWKNLGDEERPVFAFFTTIHQGYVGGGSEQRELISCEANSDFTKFASIKVKAMKGKEYTFPEEDFMNPDHEDSLSRHLVYHLTKEHRLPGKSEVKLFESYDKTMLELKPLLESDMSVDAIQTHLKNEVICNNDKTMLSLEVIFNILLHQLRNAAKILEETVPQGYVYGLPSFDRPKKSREIYNFLLILALKCVQKESPLNHMKSVIYDKYLRDYVKVLEKLFPNKVHEEAKAVSILEEFKGAAFISPTGTHGKEEDFFAFMGKGNFQKLEVESEKEQDIIEEEAEIPVAFLKLTVESKKQGFVWVQELLKEKELFQVWAEIKKLPEEQQMGAYFGLVKAYTKDSDYKNYFKDLHQEIKSKMYPELLPKIYKHLAHDIFKEQGLKGDDTEIAHQLFCEISHISNMGGFFLKIVEEHRSDGNYEKMFEILEGWDDFREGWMSEEYYSELVPLFLDKDKLDEAEVCLKRVYDKNAFYKVTNDQYKILAEKREQNKQWTQAAYAYRKSREYRKARDCYIKAAQELKVAGKTAQAIELLINKITDDKGFLSEDNYQELLKMKEIGDYSQAVRIAMREELY